MSYRPSEQEAVRPQRIAILVKRFPRLSETFILNEVLELRRQGLPVDVYAIMDPHETRSQPEAVALAHEVTYLRDGSLWRLFPIAARTIRRHPLGSLRAAGWVLTRHSRAAARNYLYALVLVDVLARSGPAHLHAHFLHSPAAIAFIARKVSGQPYSVTGHAKDIYTTLPENLRMRCHGAKFVTTCTAANRDHLVQDVGLEPSVVHLCRHGVDVDRFAAVNRQPRAGAIVSIGRLVPKKGFDVLLRACGILHRHDIQFELRIVGSGDLRDELRRVAFVEGIADQVHFLGARSQDEVIVELTAAEIFALTPVVLPDGDRDGIPNVLLEAMAVGVPVVASAVSGIPEVVVDGVTGRLVPERSPDHVAAVLHELLADRSAREELAAAGRQHVFAQSRWEQVVIPIRDLLREQLDPEVCEDANRVTYEVIG
jgi:glycosyltransferase involved in cell wall biosynthesis